MALADTAAQVSEAAQTAAADQRAAALNSTISAITTEAQRIADAAAKSAAEKKLGTLATPTSAKQPTVLDPPTLAALATIDASAPWVSPIAVGSYTRGAAFGAYGVWSHYHTGFDLVAPYGTPIRATGSGVVLVSDGAAEPEPTWSFCRPTSAARCTRTCRPKPSSQAPWSRPASSTAMSA